MDRLERHGAALYTAPGLVPGLLGLVLLVLGVVLAARNRAVTLPSPGFRWGNTPLVLVLCLGYAVGLVGRAPFWLATFIFVTTFIAIFEYPSRRRMALAPVYAAATSLVVTYLFETVFLVRLP
jgi:Tripartite tricarboxylate transporter TctB family